MTEQLNFYREYGYRRDMESQIRDIGSGRPDSTATQAANQIKHLKSALKEMVSIVEIHSSATKNNFAWAELEDARAALMMTKIIIGVDPDSDKHGVAIYCDGKLKDLAMWQLIDFYNTVKYWSDCGAKIVVHMENVCGNNAAFSKKGANAVGAIRNVSRSLGKCQQAQIELERILKHLNINVTLHKISSSWKKTESKKQFELATGWKKRSNEDTRSAAYFGFLGVKRDCHHK